MALGARTFRCDGCGLIMDRDCNAAANLAAWAEDTREGWRPTPSMRRFGAL
jgi:putative transposase